MAQGELAISAPGRKGVMIVLANRELVATRVSSQEVHWQMQTNKSVPVLRVVLDAAIILLLSISAVGQVRKPLKAVFISGSLQRFDLPFCGGDEALSIDLPERYNGTHLQEEDFDVFAFARGPNGGSSITIYIGHHPTLRHPAAALRRPFAFGGIATTLYSWREGRGKSTAFVREVLVDKLFPSPELLPLVTGGWRYVSPNRPPLPPAIGVPGFQHIPDCTQGIVVHVYFTGVKRQLVDGLVTTAAATFNTKRRMARMPKEVGETPH